MCHYPVSVQWSKLWTGVFNVTFIDEVVKQNFLFPFVLYSPTLEILQIIF
jgi:hypothetical protein